jgi:hypothetical protein
VATLAGVLELILRDVDFVELWESGLKCISHILHCKARGEIIICVYLETVVCREG